MNNGFGSTCYFGRLDAGITQNLYSGSVIKFEIENDANKVVTKDGNNDAVRVDFTDRTITATFEILLYGSGSKIANIYTGDLITFATAITDVLSGSFYIEKPKISFDPDKSATVTGTAVKHVRSNGTTLP